MVKWKGFFRSKYTHKQSRSKNSDCNTKLEQWLWLIDGSEEEKVNIPIEKISEITEMCIEDVKKIVK